MTPVKRLTSQAEKKRLGAFYTPSELSDVLAAWAIQKKTDKVLEPSFGGCGFLKSCAERLVELGNPLSRLPLYGCDIDPNAFDYLADTIGSLVDLSNFVQADFLTLDTPVSWPKHFDVVIGNPPYIAYQQIDLEAQQEATKRIKALGLEMDLRSSLWAYFIVMSLAHLKPEGRIAWVLPGSFLQANYAKPIRQFLGKVFKEIADFKIQKRLFLYEGTDESTVVLLATGYQSPSLEKKDIPLIYCQSYEDFSKAIVGWEKGNALASSCEFPVLGSINTKAKVSFAQLQTHLQCHRLSKYAYTRIGLVTGENKFFVLNREMAEQHKINSSDLTPILAKFSSIESLSFSKSDWKKDFKANNRCLLVSTKKVPPAEGLAKYLATFPSELIGTISTFKKRKLWYGIDDCNVPDAFFPVMHHTGPQIALNTARVNCTNSIHRLYFNEGISLHTRKLLAISILTSFSQLSAEIVGRKYGAGVLKHEPREAERISILMPEHIAPSVISKQFTKISRLIKRGHLSEARESADAFIFSNLNEVDKSECGVLSAALTDAREHRYADRKKVASSKNHSIPNLK